MRRYTNRCNVRSPIFDEIRHEFEVSRRSRRESVILRGPQWSDHCRAKFYCGMCFDSATACRLGCNGAGTCIQACDDMLKTAVSKIAERDGTGKA